MTDVDKNNDKKHENPIPCVGVQGNYLPNEAAKALLASAEKSGLPLPYIVNLALLHGIEKGFCETLDVANLGQEAQALVDFLIQKDIRRETYTRQHKLPGEGKIIVETIGKHPLTGEEVVLRERVL